MNIYINLLLTRKKLSKEPFSMYSVTIITGLPGYMVNKKLNLIINKVQQISHDEYIQYTLIHLMN